MVTKYHENLPCHGVHGALVGLAHVLLADNQFDPVPTFRLVHPLMGVGSNLGAQGFGHYQNVANNGGIGTKNTNNFVKNSQLEFDQNLTRMVIFDFQS